MRATRAITALIVVSITLFALAGCSSSQTKAIEISQADAISISGGEKPTAQRIVALANGSAEIVSALGYKENLVGRDIASTDADLSQIPIVTSGHLLVAEKIIALNPDLVLIDKSTGPATALAALRSAKINLIQIPEAWTLIDIAGKVTSVAEAIGTPIAGMKLVAALSVPTSSTLNSKKPLGVVFLYLRGGSAIYLIGGKGSGADSLITAAGGIDLGAKKLANPFNSLSAEVMAALDPDVILVMSKGLESVGGLTGLIQLPGVAQTKAGKRQAVIAVDDSLLLSFGPRTADLLTKLRSELTKVSAS